MGPPQSFVVSLYRRMFEVAPSQALCQTLIKTDILLSHDTLNKISLVSRPSKQTLPKILVK
jgi:hypothetical protein